MPDTIRIGTRESKLAVWQATRVGELLSQHGYQSELVYIKSEGDINLTTPLYELGVQGIFTKALDIALLENSIDIAVHSYKDIPTQPAKGLQVVAVLKRDNPYDVLVSNEPFDKLQPPFTIATSSIRRKAQWLHRLPGSMVENLRGNVNTRLDKLKASGWSGAIFAAAGLERLGLKPSQTGPQLLLEWMIPAPAQGAIAIVAKEDDPGIQQACILLNDTVTQNCTRVERDFLRLLQGGCSTSISGLSTIENDRIFFKGNITAPDGTESIDVLLEDTLSGKSTLAQRAAEEIMRKGAGKYIQQ
jgi:hydroxymethylbilane synthase